jgi:hypothetical protein
VYPTDNIARNAGYSQAADVGVRLLVSTWRLISRAFMLSWPRIKEKRAVQRREVTDRDSPTVSSSFDRPPASAKVVGGRSNELDRLIESFTFRK